MSDSDHVYMVRLLLRTIREAREEGADRDYIKNIQRELATLRAEHRDSALVIVHCDGFYSPATLGAFLRDNGDAIDATEAATIRATIARGESYNGGGGAGAQWSVRPVD